MAKTEPRKTLIRPHWASSSRYDSFKLHHPSFSEWKWAPWQTQEDPFSKREPQKARLVCFVWTDKMKLELLGKSHQPYTEEKMKPSKKRIPCLLWNMEEAHWYFGVALLPQALSALNLCRAQWNQKTMKALCSKTYSAVSESCVFVTSYGFYNRIMTTYIRIHKKALKSGWEENVGSFWSGLL